MNITDLKFDKGFTDELIVFTGRLNDKMFCGDNMNGQFRVVNVNMFNEQEIEYIELYINNVERVV